ncbi:hypothetical protein [Pseudarthrobacter sp. NamB4]|uniref:hypothetical protein n=1 Tax=Pseudarthrobacter sp. NamB4 TaxID=2576837 RepID=UPI00197AAAE1|nr:hypothetical protein [Pseudarthrobacter sp. NamB4]
MTLAAALLLTAPALGVLVLTSMVFIGLGLARTMFFAWTPVPSMIEDARIGASTSTPAAPCH